MNIQANTCKFTYNDRDERYESKKSSKSDSDLFYDLLNSPPTPYQNIMLPYLYIDGDYKAYESTCFSSSTTFSCMIDTDIPHAVTFNYQHLNLRVCNGPLNGVVINISKQGGDYVFKISSQKKSLTNNLLSQTQSICEAVSLELGVNISLFIIQT